MLLLFFSSSPSIRYTTRLICGEVYLRVGLFFPIPQQTEQGKHQNSINPRKTLENQTEYPPVGTQSGASKDVGRDSLKPWRLPNNGADYIHRFRITNIALPLPTGTNSYWNGKKKKKRAWVSTLYIQSDVIHCDTGLSFQHSSICLSSLLEMLTLAMFVLLIRSDVVMDFVNVIIVIVSFLLQTLRL